MIARPVPKSEILEDRGEAGKRPSDAIEAEWKKLFDKQVFDMESVKPWREIAIKARRERRVVHMGRAFGIMVEKNHQLDESDPRRKYKYRVVLQGNNVHTANWESAIFQGLGSSPASMDAGDDPMSSKSAACQFASTTLLP